MTTRVETIGRRRSRAASSWVDRHLRWLLVTPAVALVLALSIFPLVFSLWVLFVEFDFSVSNDHPWVGLDNFRDNFNDPNWWHSIKITAILACVCVAVEFVLGLMLALAMMREVRGRAALLVHGVLTP